MRIMTYDFAQIYAKKNDSFRDPEDNDFAHSYAKYETDEWKRRYEDGGIGVNLL